MRISAKNAKKIQELEESLWRSETRFDRQYMDKILAPDFFEFGRSGRIYTREDTLCVPCEPIQAQLPLKNLKIHFIGENVALVTYISEVTYEGRIEVGNRSSLWFKIGNSWQLKFHQGTPVNK